MARERLEWRFELARGLSRSWKKYRYYSSSYDVAPVLSLKTVRKQDCEEKRG